MAIRSPPSSKQTPSLALVLLFHGFGKEASVCCSLRAQLIPRWRRSQNRPTLHTTANIRQIHMVVRVCALRPSWRGSLRSLLEDWVCPCNVSGWACIPRLVEERYDFTAFGLFDLARIDDFSRKVVPIGVHQLVLFDGQAWHFRRVIVRDYGIVTHQHLVRRLSRKSISDSYQFLDGPIAVPSQATFRKRVLRPRRWCEGTCPAWLLEPLDRCLGLCAILRERQKRILGR